MILSATRSRSVARIEPRGQWFFAAWGVMQEQPQFGLPQPLNRQCEYSN
jgi:hypothetical protein